MTLDRLIPVRSHRPQPCCCPLQCACPVMWLTYTSLPHKRAFIWGFMGLLCVFSTMWFYKFGRGRDQIVSSKLSHEALFMKITPSHLQHVSLSRGLSRRPLWQMPGCQHCQHHNSPLLEEWQFYTCASSCIMLPFTLVITNYAAHCAPHPP